MNIRIIIHLILFQLLLSLLHQKISAQDPDNQVIGKLNAYFNEVYGLDQKLISGVQYYNKYPRALGNEFLGSVEFDRGRLVINGVEYNHVDIRYDVYNQQINLQFKYNTTAINTVIIEKDKIDEFELRGMQFRKCYFPQTDTSFFQIVAEGKISCLYYWYKNLTFQTSLRNVYEFSEPRKKAFLLIDSVLYRYNGKLSFIKLYPETRSVVRKYIRQNQIRLRDAPDPIIKNLIDYCNSLSKPEATK
jgi:hypothetical protein